MKKTLLFILPLLLAGCGKKEEVKFLGQWNGAFQVEKVLQGPDTAEDRKHHTLRGYLSVVLNKNSYIMHLEGEQQQIDIKGKWTFAGSQLTLNPTQSDVKTEGGERGPNPNRKYVPQADLYEASLKNITLKLSPDGSTLKGSTMTIAILEGTHLFKKD